MDDERPISNRPAFPEELTYRCGRFWQKNANGLRLLPFVSISPMGWAALEMSRDLTRLRPHGPYPKGPLPNPWCAVIPSSASKSTDCFQHLSLGGIQVLAQAAKGLVPRHPLHHMKRNAPTHRRLRQRTAEAVGAYSLETQC